MKKNNISSNQNSEDLNLRSEEFSTILEEMPSWSIHWGTITFYSIIIIAITGCYLFKYPSILSIQLIIQNEHPNHCIQAKESSNINILKFNNNLANQGDYLAYKYDPLINHNNILQLKEALLNRDLNKIEII